MGWFKERFVEAGFERAFNKVVSMLGDKALGTVSKTVERIEEVQKKASEKRGELLSDMRKLSGRDSTASANLQRRHGLRQKCLPRTYGEKKKYGPLDENWFTAILVELKDALSEESEKNDYWEALVWLGRMKDEEFDTTLELLDHSQIKQLLRTVIQEMKKIGEWVVEHIPSDEETARTIGEFNNFLVDNGIFRNGKRWTPNNTINANSQVVVNNPAIVNVHAQGNSGGGVPSNFSGPAVRNSWPTIITVAIISIVVGVIIAQFAM